MLKTFITAALIGAVSAKGKKHHDDTVVEEPVVEEPVVEEPVVEEPVVEEPVVEEPVVPAGPCDAFAGNEFQDCNDIIILEGLVNDSAITGPCASIENDFEAYNNCVSINTVIVGTDDASVTDQCASHQIYLDFESCVDLILNPPAPEGPCSDLWQTSDYDTCTGIQDMMAAMDSVVYDACSSIRTDEQEFQACVDTALTPRTCEDYIDLNKYFACLDVAQAIADINDPKITAPCETYSYDFNQFMICVQSMETPVSQVCTGDCLQIAELRDFYNNSAITDACESYTQYQQFYNCSANQVLVQKKLAESVVDDGSN